MFLNPQTQTWETDDAYLSGDVKTKLRAAEAAALTDSRFQENVEALQSVQPADLSATEIDARLARKNHRRLNGGAGSSSNRL